MRLRLLILSGLSVLFWLPAPGHAQDSVLTNRATEMRAAPDDAAALVKSLPAQASVKVLERKGRWTKVRDVGDSGWVLMMHLRGGVVVETAPAPSATASATTGFLSGIERLLIGPAQETKRAQSATLGVRGLTAEDLQSASPNQQGLTQLNRLAVSYGEAERYARDARLATISVPELAAEAAKGAGK